MKKELILILLCFLAVGAKGQYFNVAEEQVEVGIIEKLDEGVPLNLEFKNENNETVSLGSIIDKPTILSFVYFECPGLCPPLLAGVSDLIDKLDMELGVDYQVVTISFNPKDSPVLAKEKKLNYVTEIPEADREHWIWLTGEQENITAITESVGYRFKPQGVDFAHPSAIIALSPVGKITRYLYGLTYLPFDAKMALIEAQKGISRPTINKILDICFAYDPASRTYSLQITRVVGALLIFAALTVLIVLLVKGRRKTEK